MQENVFKILEEAGVKVSLHNTRGYRPTIPLQNYDVKLLKPQNILGMLEAGTRDVGFAGADWIAELGIEGLVEVMDTGMDPVRIVAAAPDPKILEKGVGLGGRKLIVASEYAGLTKKWLEKRGLGAAFLRAYGATESLPPEDADIIVDNAATGSTLKANNLEILDTIMNSTTRMFASKAAWENPAKRQRIEKLAVLLKAVLEARKRLMVTFNLPSDKLEALVPHLSWYVSSAWRGPFYQLNFLPSPCPPFHFPPPHSLTLPLTAPHQNAQHDRPHSVPSTPWRCFRYNSRRVRQSPHSHTYHKSSRRRQCHRV